MSHKNIFSHTKRLYFLWILILFSSVIAAQENQDSKSNKLYNITVTDESGKALPNTQLIIGEGENYLTSDEAGKINFEAYSNDFLTFSLSGYNDVIVLAKKISKNGLIMMKSQKLFATSSDLVPMPFVDLMKRNITSGTIVIKGSELEKYSGSDIRNAFTGLVSGMEVRELNGSPGLNVIEKYNGNPEKINIQLRGRSPIYIVDGVPTAMTEMPLDPSEIETVTIIKDIVGKAMYGPVGADGVILIKTYHGKVNERTIKVNVEKGVSVVDRMPEWSNGAEYAKMNNLARYNSNLRDNTSIPQLYTQDAIDKYAVNNGYDMYYPSNNFRSQMFKNTMAYNRVNVSASGGNEGMRYFSYLGLTNEGDIFKIGSTSNYNRIVSRSNLDIRINELLKVRLGLYGAMNISQSPVYSGGGDYLAMNNAIVDANTISPIAFPIYANNDPELPKPWFAVTSLYPNNPIGELTGKGFGTESARIGSTNLSFDFDMSHLVRGLTSETYLGFNILNQVRLGKAQNYSAYTVTPAKNTMGADTVLLTKVHDGVDQANLSKLADYYFQTFVVTQTFKHTAKIGKIDILNSLTYSLTRATRDTYKDDQRQHSLVWSGVLNYDNRFCLQAVVDYAGTYSFAPENRYGLFPTVGASWIVSEEKFMKSLNFINYLKLRAETGILGYDNFQAPYYFRDNYTSSTYGAFGPSTAGWLGSTKESTVYHTTYSRYGNPNLGWEKRKEFNVGLEGVLFSNKVNFDLSYYNQLRDGIVDYVNNTTPYIAGLPVYPKINYEQIRYSGIELAVNYNNNVGDFKYSFGFKGSTQDAIYEKVDEPNYRNVYQSVKGQSIYNYYGLKYIGRYITDAEALEIPSLYDQVLHAGDLKYEDKNNDGVIDDNDRSVVGHTAPRLIYSLNFELQYKGIELSILGTGRAFYDMAQTSSYFWNGWGDGNYSAFVRNNLSTEAYPGLTYNKVENNFKSSDFWLVDGGFFKIQNAQLAYNLPQNWVKSIKMKSMKVFVNGANLYTMTKVKYVDPESINSGVTTYPLFINFTGGIKLTF